MSFGKIHADDVQIKGDTAQDAIIKDKNGNVVGHDSDLNEYVGYNVTYNWSIPNGTNIKSGDIASFDLPDNVKVNQDISFDVYYKGNAIGTFSIKSGQNQGTLTFNDYLQNHPMNNVTGTITFGVNGTNASASNQKWHINKVNWIDQKSGNPVWNIAMNPKKLIMTILL